MGNSLKTISMRLRGYSEETESYTEDVEVLSGKIADLTKTAKTPGGISLFTDADKKTYKSTYQILKEISEIWEDLDDATQARLQDAVGGKYQGNAVAAIAQNFEAAEKAMNNMANSAGNAEAEMDVIRDSAEYALNEMKETFTSLSQNAVTRDFLKDLIHTGTKAIEIVDKLVSSFGALPTVLGVIIGQIASMNSIKNKGLFKFDISGGLTFQGARSPQEWLGNLKTGVAGIFTGKTVAYKNNLSLIHQINSALATNADVNELCAKAENSNSAAVRELGQKLKDGTANTSSCIAATKQLGAEAKNASFGMKALNAAVAVGKTALTMFVTTLISMLIGKVIKAIDDSIHAVENLNKEFKDLASESKTIADELESINEQLKDTDEKIRDLEKLPKLTLLQKDELAALKAYNEELERQRKQRENEARQNQLTAKDDAKKLMQSIFLQGGASTPKSAFIGIRSPSMYAMSAKKTEDEIAALENNYKKYKDLIEKYEKLNDELAELEIADNRDEYAIGRKKEDIGDIESQILDLETSWQNIADNLEVTDFLSEKTLNAAKDLLSQWAKIYHQTPKTFLEIYNSAEFARVHDALQQLAKDGELTAEKFDELNDTDIDGIEDFKKALEEIGVTNAAEIVESIIVNVKDLNKETNIGKGNIKDYAKTLEELYEVLDKFISKQEKLNETFKKLKLGGTLTRDEIYDLVKQMPAISEYLDETAEGWVISAEGIKKASDELAETEKKSLQDKIDALQKNIDVIGQFVGLENEAEYSSDPDSVRNRDDYKELYEKAQQIRQDMGIDSTKEWSEVLSDLGSEMSGFVFLMDLVDEKFNANEQGLEGLKERYEEFKNEISDFNTQIQTIDSAINTLNKDTLLSYDELNALLDIDPNLEYENKGDRYSVSIEALEELRKKSYETKNARIEDMKAVVQAEINESNTLKSEYQKRLDEIKNMGVSETSLKALAETTNNLDGVNGELDYLYDLLKKLDGLEQNITIDIGTGDDDISDKLQKQIDHYKTVIDAVSAVRDKYAEAIDNEIDVLQDSKDALKDANDERQRELDLIEARNDLENAKKRKVYVYSEGEGFKQVQDQKAVKEAEEKYRDAITDIQEAEIDKEIDKRKKQKEALDNAIKDLVDAEKNIQNAMVVSQAMKEYGLTDAKDLLSLPDDVKQSIIDGLADSMLQKDIEDNKENEKYNEVTLDTILKELGSTKKASDIDPAVFDNVTQKAYNNAIKEFTDKLKNDAQARIDNVTYNNAPVINANFTINNADDPEAVAETVNKEIGNFLRQYCDSIK